MIRLFHINKRLIIATGRARAAVLEGLCEAAVEQLEANQPASISWSCNASEEKGHFVAVFERLRDGAPHPTALNAKQIDAAQEAVLLAYSRLSDPTAIEAYERRTLLRADEAYEVNIPPPKGMVQVLGRVVSITYDGTLQGQDALWQHEFKPDAAPALVADENTRLFLVGGRYQVADVGIIDETPPDMPGGFEEVDFIAPDVAIPELAEVPLPGAVIEEVDPFADVPFESGSGIMSELDIEDVQDLDKYTQLFKETIPSASPEQIQRGMHYYEELSAAFGAEPPLLQAQIAAALMIAKPSGASTVDRLWLNALNQVGVSDRKQRLRIRTKLLELELIKPDRAFHAKGSLAGWQEGEPLTFGREQREQLRDVRNAAVFGGIVNADLAGPPIIAMVEGIPELEKLTQTQLAQLARIALGLRGGKRGQASWTSAKKPELLDELASIGARWNPTHKERQNMARRARRNPYTDAQRETFGELAELASNPAHPFGLSQREIDTIVYNIIPIYQQDIQRQVERLEAYQDQTEMSARAAGAEGLREYDARRDLIYQLQRQIREAESIAEKLDEMEGIGSNPLLMDTPVEFRTVRELATRYNRQAVDNLIKDVPGASATAEHAQLIAYVVSEMSSSAGRDSLAEYLRERIDAETRKAFESNPLGFEEEELIIGVAPPNDLRTRDARERDARTRESRGPDPTAWLNAQLEEFRRDNPKQDGRWHRKETQAFGLGYYLDAGDVFAKVIAYKPRKHPLTDKIAELYQHQHEQQLPKGTKWLARTTHYPGGRLGQRVDMNWTAHTTLAAAKKASERAMKRVRANPVTANAGLLAGAPARHEGFGLDARSTNAGVLAMPGGPRPNAFGLTRTNAGLLDPPQVRRSLPRQP